VVLGSSKTGLICCFFFLPCGISHHFSSICLQFPSFFVAVLVTMGVLEDANGHKGRMVWTRALPDVFHIGRSCNLPLVQAEIQGPGD